MNRSDLDLHHQVRHGKREALKRFIESHQEQLFRRCCKRLRDQYTCEDIVQEAFIKFWQSLQKIKDIRGYKKYLYTILDNLVTDKQRSASYKKDIPPPPGPGGNDTTRTIEDCIEPNFEGTPEQVLLNQEEIAQAPTVINYVNRLMNELPREQRDAIYVVHLRGLTYKEAGKELGYNENTVKAQVHRGLLRFTMLAIEHKLYVLPGHVTKKIFHLIYLENVPRKNILERAGTALGIAHEEVIKKATAELNLDDEQFGPNNDDPGTGTGRDKKIIDAIIKRGKRILFEAIQHDIEELRILDEQ